MNASHPAAPARANVSVATSASQPGIRGLPRLSHAARFRGGDAGFDEISSTIPASRATSAAICVHGSMVNGIAFLPNAASLVEQLPVMCLNFQDDEKVAVTVERGHALATDFRAR